MSKIRVADFGNRVAPPTSGTRVPAGAFITGDAERAQGTQQLAAGLLNKERAEDDRLAQQAAAEQRQRTAELKSAQRISAYAGFQADLDEYTDNLVGQLERKEVKRDDLTATFDKGLGDLRKARLEALDPESRATVEAHTLTAERSARTKLRRAFDIDMKQERIATINTTLEDYQRLGVKDPAGAIRQAGILLDNEGPGVLGADKVAGTKQSFAEKVWASHFTQRMNDARRDGRSLTKLEADVQGNETLDPDKKNVLLGRIGGFKEQLAAQAERAQRSREATIRAQVESRDRLILAGFTPSAEQDLAMLAASKGTVYEPVVRAQVQFASQTSKFSNMGAREQETFLNQFEAEVRKNPTPDGLKTLEAYQKIAKNQQQLVHDDPISFAGQKGLAQVTPLDFTLAGSNPNGFKDALQARVQVSRGMQGQYGAPLKVLTKEEARTLSDFMRRGTAEHRTQLLSALKGAMPDAESYNATMQQIAPDSPVTAWAGSLMNRRPFVQQNLVRPNVETQATRVSQLMVRGESILNPTAADRKEDGRGGTFKMPQDKDLLAGFEGVMGESYRGRQDAHQIAYQAARAVYASLSADEGDYTGEYRAARWEQAINLSTGGASNFNGAKVPRPYGMREDEFKNAVYTEMGRLSASGRVGLNQQQLQRLQLEASGDSQYLVRSGTGYLLDKGGRPVVIDLMSSSVRPEGFKDEKGKPLVESIPK